jgi:glucosamine-phosphate N-acetyltransferase
MTEEVIFAPVAKDHLPEVIDLLQAISEYRPDVSEHSQIWQSHTSQTNVHSIVACLRTGAVVGYGSIVIESKIRGGKLGHIEDIVISEALRGRGLGKLLIAELSQIAKSQECYKIALHCKVENVSFYEKTGLSQTGVSMQTLL